MRPFEETDAPAVASLLSHREVADGMLAIPHPYPADLAVSWIHGREAAATEGLAYSWAVVRTQDEELMGSVTLTVDANHRRAELGYWLGMPYWNQGYVTEALAVIVTCAFATLGIHRVQATVFPRNVASVRVLEKLGFEREGVLRDFAHKGDGYETVMMFARLKQDARHQLD